MQFHDSNTPQLNYADKDPELGSQASSSDQVQLGGQIFSLRGLQQTMRRISISKKIGLGYALAIGVAVFGTALGLVVGDYYEKQAEQRDHTGHDTGIFLDSLHDAVLQARLRQLTLDSLLRQPAQLEQEYERFRADIVHIKSLMSQADSFMSVLEGEGLQNFSQVYQGTTEAYSQEVETLLQRIDPGSLSEDQIPAAQEQLASFANGVTANRFARMSNELAEISRVAFEEEEKAEAALERASKLREQIVLGSMFLSGGTAILLAFYTSRAIVRPLRATIDVAKQVTRDSNFDLQAPITTEDEIGALATSLNQLIQRVKHLLKEEKAAALRQQQLQESQLIQSEKMSSLGRMVAGIAHEINNPINFISGNLVHADTYVQDLLELIQIYRAQVPSPPGVVQTQVDEIDLEFLVEDLPKLLRSMKLGADRSRQIATSLKNFSRLDDADAHSVDLHSCLDSTLLILNSRIKKGVTIVRNYGEIPTIEGYSGLLYQVFMNLLSNALDALDEQEENKTTSSEAFGTQDRSLPHLTPQIVITTECLDDTQAGSGQVVVRISDNGSGMTAATQAKMFDTFFTTKPRGIGTGLGLAISYQIVVEKHKGTLTCKSEPGVGTEFAIALPIQHHTSSETFSRMPQLAGSIFIE